MKSVWVAMALGAVLWITSPLLLAEGFWAWMIPLAVLVSLTALGSVRWLKSETCVNPDHSPFLHRLDERIRQTPPSGSSTSFAPTTLYGTVVTPFGSWPVSPDTGPTPSIHPDTGDYSSSPPDGPPTTQTTGHAG